MTIREICENERKADHMGRTYQERAAYLLQLAEERNVADIDLHELDRTFICRGRKPRLLALVEALEAVKKRLDEALEKEEQDGKQEN